MTTATLTATVTMGLTPAVTLQLRSGGKPVAENTAAHVLAMRALVGRTVGETLHVKGPYGWRAIRSCQATNDIRPISGPLMPFAVLDRLRRGLTLTVEVVR